MQLVIGHDAGGCLLRMFLERAAPIGFEKTSHSFGETVMFEDNGGPGRTREDGVEQSDQATFAIEQREFHGEAIGETNFDADAAVFAEAVAVFFVDGTGFDEEAAIDTAGGGIFDELLVERVDSEGRAREFDVFASGGGQHATVMDGRLHGVVDETEEVEGAAAVLAFEEGGAQVFDEAAGEARLFGEIVLQHFAAAAEIGWDGEAGVDGGEELGALLDDLRKALFYQAIEHLIDLLARHMGARGEFQGFEAWMA